MALLGAFEGESPKSKAMCLPAAQLDINKRRGVGLDALSVRCLTCSAKRSLRGITADATVRSLGLRCSGRQPWQHPGDAEKCRTDPKILQRGASNLYFASVASALDIPPESRRTTTPNLLSAIKQHDMFAVVYSNPTGFVADRLKRAIAEELGCTTADVDQAVDDERRLRSGGAPVATGQSVDRQTAEWEALLELEPETDHNQTFATRRVDLGSGHALRRSAPPLVDDVVLVTRLREVRALTGFRRYDLEEGTEVRPDLGGGLPWLPAVEVFGEGVFIRFDEGLLRTWESQGAVASRVELLRSRHEQSFLKGRVEAVSARFVLIHTIAHLLLRRLAFEAGYPAASLRERLLREDLERSWRSSGGPSDLHRRRRLRRNAWWTRPDG